MKMGFSQPVTTRCNSEQPYRVRLIIAWSQVQILLGPPFVYRGFSTSGLHPLNPRRHDYRILAQEPIGLGFRSCRCETVFNRLTLGELHSQLLNLAVSWSRATRLTWQLVRKPRKPARQASIPGQPPAAFGIQWIAAGGLELQ